MTDSPEKKQDAAGSAAAKAAPAAEKSATAPAAERSAEERRAEERRARIKKMRGWLSPRTGVADDFGPEDAALYYGEGHSGWNR